MDWYQSIAWSDVEKEFIVVEQDTVSRLEGSDSVSNVTHRFIYNSGAFNKAWGINVAAGQANYPVFVALDADILIHHTILMSALSAVADGYDAMNPFEHLVDLDERQTEDLERGATSVNTLFDLPVQDRNQYGERLCFCGGLFVIDRDFFLNIGGMDESFRGWGGEDDAMTLKIANFSNRIATSGVRPALHLWHPRSARQNAGDTDYQTNLSMLDDYRSYNTDQWKAIAATHRRIMGDKSKYAFE